MLRCMILKINTIQILYIIQIKKFNSFYTNVLSVFIFVTNEIKYLKLVKLILPA
jgi:hypothetical protein